MKSSRLFPLCLLCVAVMILNNGKGSPLRHLTNASTDATTTNSIRNGTIGVIHLGKCHGMGLRRTIQTIKSGMIRKRGFEVYHMGHPKYDDHVDWIALVRDPVDRVIASFLYEHPKNAPYLKNPMAATLPFVEKLELYDCFDTVDDLAAALGAPAKSDDRCLSLAKQLFHRFGKLNGMPHFVYNYNFYYQELLKQADQKTIYVVRNENMVHDLNRINVKLGGIDSSYTRLRPFSHWKPDVDPAQLPATNRTLSAEGMTNLCLALCHEIQIYKELLDKGVNIDVAEGQVAKSILQQKCPKQVQSNVCSPPARAVGVVQTSTKA